MLDYSQLYKEDFLKSRGWSTWYNDLYWVHPKTVVDPSRQDYTDYGMNLDDAYMFEIENKPPFKPICEYGTRR